jgi:hypothetical protein
METITLCSPIAKELGEKGLHWREWGSLFVWRDIGNFLDVQRKPPEKKGFSKANISSPTMNPTLIFCLVANIYVQSTVSRSLIKKS